MTMQTREKQQGQAPPLASGNEVNANLPRECPQTPNAPQAMAAQQPGGGGAPETGTAYSSGEGVNEDQQRRSGSAS